MRLVLRNIKIRDDAEYKLENASFTFEEGKVYGLTGGSERLRKLLAEFISERTSAGSGDVIIDRTSGFKNAVRRNSAVILEEAAFPDNVSVSEYCAVYGKIHNVSDLSHIEECLKTVDLYERRDDAAGKLKREERIKLQLALMIMYCPEIIIASDLSCYCSEYFGKFTGRVKDGHIIILFSEDSEELCKITDEIVAIDNGCLMTVNMSGGTYVK